MALGAQAWEIWALYQLTRFAVPAEPVDATTDLGRYVQNVVRHYLEGEIRHELVRFSLAGRTHYGLGTIPSSAFPQRVQITGSTLLTAQMVPPACRPLWQTLSEDGLHLYASRQGYHTELRIGWLDDDPMADGYARAAVRQQRAAGGKNPFRVSLHTQATDKRRSATGGTDRNLGQVIRDAYYTGLWLDPPASLVSTLTEAEEVAAQLQAYLASPEFSLRVLTLASVGQTDLTLGWFNKKLCRQGFLLRRRECLPEPYRPILSRIAEQMLLPTLTIGRRKTPQVSLGANLVPPLIQGGIRAVLRPIQAQGLKSLEAIECLIEEVGR